MGWGVNDDSNHHAPARCLNYLVINITQCPHDYSGEWVRTAYGAAAPAFICTRALPSIGGPCDGDDGGVHQNTQKMLNDFHTSQGIVDSQIEQVSLSCP